MTSKNLSEIFKSEEYRLAMIGKSPKTKAALEEYLLSFESGDYKTQQEVCDKQGISIPAMRNSIVRLEKLGLLNRMEIYKKPPWKYHKDKRNREKEDKYFEFTQQRERMKVRSDILDEVLEKVRTLEYNDLRDYLQGLIEYKELAVIKCSTCGEVVAVEDTSTFLTAAFKGGSPLLNYLIFKHIAENPDHRVTVKAPGPLPLELPLGDMLMSAFHRTCHIHGRYPDAELLLQVERYRRIAIGE